MISILPLAAVALFIYACVTWDTTAAVLCLCLIQATKDDEAVDTAQELDPPRKRNGA